MYYKKGFKYYLYSNEVYQTDIKPPAPVEYDFIKLDTDGRLYLFRGFPWDGPSGPAIDTEDSMSPSAIHDALCRLVRQGLLDVSWKWAIDKEYYKRCREVGMPRIRAWVHFVVIKLYPWHEESPNHPIYAP